MDAVPNKTALLNSFSMLALENSYSSDETITARTMPRISANPRNNAGNNFRAGHQLVIEHFDFFSGIPVEDALSSDETIAKGNISGINNPSALSTSPSRQTNLPNSPAQSKSSQITYCIIPPEDALSSDETIATATILNSNNPQALSATSPRLTNRSSTPRTSLTSANIRDIENDLINSSVNGNQQRFEKLIFKQAADFANLSKTDVPLIANTINWHLQFSAQLTPGLDIAVDKRLIKRLLELGARVNTSDEKGQRNAALWMALQQSDTEVVKLLLEYGCDPNSSCALTTAAKKGALNHMQALLQYGANPNQPQNGKFALNEACLRGDLSMAKLLLQSGAKIHEKNAEMTALMSAIISGNIELCSLLIQSGAKAHIPTDEQLAYFSLQLAEEHTGVNIYELMIDLTKAMSITDGGQPDNNSTNILTLAKLCLAIPQDQNVPLNFSYEKLLGQFCNHYILSKTYFSIAPAGASELEQMHAYIQNGITNNSIIIEMAKLFAAEIYKRDGVKFTFDY